MDPYTEPYFETGSSPEQPTRDGTPPESLRGSANGPLLLREIAEDMTILTRLTVNQAVHKARQLLDEERRQISGVLIRAILSLPVIIMAALFAGAAAVEWLGSMFPLPLPAVYGIAAACFALLAVVILIWPKPGGATR